MRPVRHSISLDQGFTANDNNEDKQMLEIDDDNAGRGSPRKAMTVHRLFISVSYDMQTKNSMSLRLLVMMGTSTPRIPPSVIKT